MAEHPAVDLSWLERPTPQTYAGVHALVADVAAQGGAVGWLHVPGPDEVREWLDGVLAGGVRMVLATSTVEGEAGVVVGCGYWQRLSGAVLRQNAEVRKVMTGSRARGRGVARAVTSALVEDAQAAGVEALSLDCRGNNHAAIGLYTSLGFVVTGRRPDWIAVGQERFDQVLLHLDLRARRGSDPEGLVRHGGRREGPGSS